MAKATADIRSLARAQTALAIRTLTGVCGSKGRASGGPCVRGQALLDRGWGKAPQPHTVRIDVGVRHSTAGASSRLTSLFVPYFGRRSCRVSISVSDVRLTEATDARPAPRRGVVDQSSNPRRTRARAMVFRGFSMCWTRSRRRNRTSSSNGTVMPSHH